MARKSDGTSTNPKQIRTDVDCRAARPKFNNGAWSAAKISDVTGGGLYLFVTPDESRSGSAASKLWRMGYRFHARQKTYSIGPYGNGKDGTFSLADARRERDKAKDLLKDGKDPSTEKQRVKHRQAAARPFEQWADEWLAKKKVEKVKRGRIVAVRDPKTIEVLELRVGYVKNRFGKLLRQDIKRPDVLAFMRSYEAKGKLETRDRVRSIGEQICNYADVEGDGYNPFRNLNGQMLANISTPRPGVTEPRDVTRVFKLISAPWTRARFGDVVGLALRFDALTIPRPGMVNEMEWSEVDWDAERWTVPAAKMKTGWDHVVPLSRQALAILQSVQKLTGHRRYAFSCSRDAPLSNNTLNKRLRLLGIDTKTDHCAHGFRTTFSTLSHHEEIKDAKAWDGDVVELQLAHLDNSTVEGLYKKHGPLALIGSRTKLMQHWADRIDHWLDPKRVMPIKCSTQR
ncbi:MAG TPA: integrase arm-type DNA-binding domain-containing protein [Pseudolabrys sp.]|nr:integrase arm-type DNA-binding domain-containing protein [Pseudolabrys sp.]